MEIHELNNFSGSLDENTYIAVDDTSDTGKVTYPAFIAPAISYTDGKVAALKAEKDAEVSKLQGETSGLIETTSAVPVELMNKAIYLLVDRNIYYTSDSSTRVTTNVIIIPAGKSIHVEASGFGKYGYDEASDGVTISYAKSFTSANKLEKDFNGPMSVRLLFANADDSNISPSDVQITVSSYGIRLDNMQSEIDELQDITSVGKNLVDLSKCVSGYISDGYSGAIAASDSYYTTDFIKVSAGQKLTLSPKIRKFLFYDAYKMPDRDSLIEQETSGPYTFTAPADGYIRASFSVSSSSHFQVEIGETATEFEPYQKTLNNDIWLNQSQKGWIQDKAIKPLDNLYSVYINKQYDLPIDSLNIRHASVNGAGVVTEGNYPKYLVSDLIMLNADSRIGISFQDVTNLRDAYVYWYDEDEAFQKLTYYNVSNNELPAFINSGEYRFLRLEFVYTQDVSPSVLTDNLALTVSLNAKSNYVSYSTGKNKFNKNDCLDNYYIAAATGVIQSNSNYAVSPFIPIKSGETFVISPRVRHFLFYDYNMAPVTNTWVNTEHSNYAFTASADGFIRFTLYKNQKDVIQVESGTTPTSYESFRLIGQEDIDFVNEKTKAVIEEVVEEIISGDIVDYSIGNVLYQKKWAVCGDSFTAGAESTAISDGKYAGQKIVYPYLIGNRNDMDIASFFAGGRTLAYPSDGTFHNSLTDPNQTYYYQNIPEDADYITIYLGINDSHHESGTGGDGEDPTGIIPLGTIDDSTTATYYGAWNVVLTWLITNRPFAHIGIIVSNGCDRQAYRTAQLEIAEKYGIPYIDLNGDSRTPVMIRSQNPNIASAVKSAVTLKQAVDYPTNQHPNDEAHEYESIFIENFLRTL